MPQAPIPLGTGGGSAIGSLLQPPGAAQDAGRQQLEAVLSQVRDIGQMVDALALDLPTAAPVVAQIKTLLKKLVTDAAQTAPVATASGVAVPTGASM